MMRKTIIILSWGFFAGAFYSCKPHIKYVPITTTQQETITIRDTIIRFRPVVYRDSITTRDTLSLLSNEYAVSYARWTGKELKHSLNMKDQEIPIQLHYIEKEKRVEVPTPYPVEVIKYQEKELSFWLRVRIGLGNLLLAGIPLIIGWCMLKIRKRWK